MAIIMTKEGRVRQLEASDLKEVAERDERVRQLERLNAGLAEQVDRMAKVVDAAIEWRDYCVAESDDDKLLEAISDYEQQVAELIKGGTR